jgi:hypothetical protein
MQMRRQEGIVGVAEMPFRGSRDLRPPLSAALSGLPSGLQWSLTTSWLPLYKYGVKSHPSYNKYYICLYGVSACGFYWSLDLKEMPRDGRRSQLDRVFIKGMQHEVVTLSDLRHEHK